FGATTNQKMSTGRVNDKFCVWNSSGRKFSCGKRIEQIVLCRNDEGRSGDFFEKRPLIIVIAVDVGAMEPSRKRFYIPNNAHHTLLFRLGRSGNDFWTYSDEPDQSGRRAFIHGPPNKVGPCVYQPEH